MTTFRFQQFSMQQQQSAMKICTDSLLFGAMTPIKGNDRVLDIGAGTGVLSLMAAQLGASKVTAVELTQEAYQEACINFKNSPWDDRLDAVHKAIQSFADTCADRYDLVVSNPPFFENHWKGSDSLRNIARHTDQLGFADLIISVDKLLTEDGLFYLLLPVHEVEKFAADALKAGFCLISRTDYQWSFQHASKVSALTFSRTSLVFSKAVLTVYESYGVYTSEAESYLAPFLLRFQKPK